MPQQVSGQDKFHSKMSLALVEKVIKYKHEENSAKQVLHFWGIYIFVVTAVFLFFSLFQSQPLVLSLTNVLHSIRNIFSIVALSLIVIGIAKLNIAKKEYEKAEAEFEQLREEIIDRQEQLWVTPQQWENRSLIFAQLEKEYGINLFHK